MDGTSRRPTGRGASILWVPLAALLLGACAGEEGTARTAARTATAAEEPATETAAGGSLPAGRLPEGATYDFGPSRGGAVDVSGAYFIGRPEAPVTVVTFGDFECQFCARSHAATAAAREELLRKGTIRLVYLDFPLPIHARSEAAAEFARCAGRAAGGGAFWRVHAALHERQSEWARASTTEAGLRALAGDLDLPWDAVSACMASDAELSAIERFRDLGVRVGVRGTPSSFFAGIPRVGAIDGTVFRAMVALARERSVDS